MQSHFSTSSFLSQLQQLMPLISAKIDRLWDSLSPILMTTSEPQLEWKRDRRGNTYLQLIEPLTERRWYFQSEQEAILWLEQRHCIRS